MMRNSLAPETASSAATRHDEELIVETMPLVTHIVRETMNRVPSHVDRDDLQSAGLTALVKAASSYEAERGVPFARYAATRIRGAILDELRHGDWASRSVRRRSRDIEETRNRLATAMGRRPSDQEVAAGLGIQVSEVHSADDDVARAQVLSLQGGTETSYEDLLVSAGPTPADLTEHRERLQYLTAGIAELPARMRVVVEQYFIAEQPMAQIAEQLGVSESRISQIRAEALVLLRDALNAALDPDMVTTPARPDGCAAQRRATYVQAVASRQASMRRPAHAQRFESVS